MKKNIKHFNHISFAAVAQVGGKNASLRNGNRLGVA